MPKGTMGDGPNPVGQTQPYEGGMNNFSDTDPGEAAKGTAAKTKALIDRAEKISTPSALIVSINTLITIAVVHLFKSVPTKLLRALKGQLTLSKKMSEILAKMLLLTEIKQ
ncbi:MAG: hypothetical protein HC780_02945 [Leptolyngbyaceae cyanobacterium CSU_1_3]|nr:hypothetical protein [Leptolyngbyaceae cyanobacterium CSU_1_3]